MTSLIECLFQCNDNIYCASINYRDDDSLQENKTKSCELVEHINGIAEPTLVKDAHYKVYTVLPEFIEVLNNLVDFFLLLCATSCSCNTGQSMHGYFAIYKCVFLSSVLYTIYCCNNPSLNYKLYDIRSRPLNRVYTIKLI